MHKTPVGSRFIAASDMCTTKSLSKLISYCLKLIAKHFREYCNGIKGSTKAIVDSSTPVLDLIDKLNNSTLVRHADTFDFSTLYSSISHNLLLQCLEELITEEFRVRGATYICVNHNNTFWSDNKVNNQDHNVSESNLIEYVRCLVDNSYIQVGDRVYKEKIGIPMGTDCAPRLANLF